MHIFIGSSYDYTCHLYILLTNNITYCRWHTISSKSFICPTFQCCYRRSGVPRHTSERLCSHDDMRRSGVFQEVIRPCCTSAESRHKAIEISLVVYQHSSSKRILGQVPHCWLWKIYPTNQTWQTSRASEEPVIFISSSSSYGKLSSSWATTRVPFDVMIDYGPAGL